ncbi:DnaD domain protein [Paenibacillus sp. 32352]|uniref:DnaD domain-containing protein n=1 Tax=Paenibacillus sp. 32352 TaxID=1969111 RepID=UPI0015C482C2|nr:DnaD domain protein [Paenibacillus sp. 32352]
MDYAQDGDITKYDPEDIADAAMWNDDAHTFIDALCFAGFIDRFEGRTVIHDWYDYAGKLIEKRESDAKRKRESRRQKDSKGMSAGRPPDGAGTVPNLTEPNQTVPYHTEDEPYTPEQHLAEIERFEALGQMQEQELASSSSAETVMDIHRKFFGTMVMSPAMSNFIQKLREKGKSEEFIKELLQEAGETSTGKPPLRFIETIAKSWIEQGIESREQAQLKKPKTGSSGGSNNRKKEKPKMPIVTDQGSREMLSKEAYRESVARTFALDGKTLTDAEFEKRWATYEAKWSVKTG